MSDVADEPILTDIESGAAQLLSTAAPDGLSNPFSSAQGGWIVGSQNVNPYTNVASATGTLDPFVGRDIDPYTNTAPDGANANAFTGSQDVNPFTGFGVVPDKIAPNPKDLTNLAEAFVRPYDTSSPVSASERNASPARVEPDMGGHDLTPEERAALLEKYAQYDAELARPQASPDKFFNDLTPNERLALYAPWAAGVFSPLAGGASPTPAAVTVGSPAAPPAPQPGPPTPATRPTELDWTTRTGWAYPAPDPRLIQPLTSFDTGNRPLNFVLNKILLPWRNFLAAAENIPLAIAVGIDDALKHSAFKMEYQAAQDMFPLERAWGLALEVGPALDYAWSWLSTNQSLRSLATAPAFWFTGAGGVGGGIPPVATVGASTLSQVELLGSGAAQQAVQTLGPEVATSLPPPPPSAGSLLLQNSSRGNGFEEAVIHAFSLPSNTRTMLGQTSSGALRGTIPDVYGGGQAHMADIKDVLRLFFTKQLQAEDAVAGWTRISGMTGSSFNIIVGPRNQVISQSLFNAVQASGGFIFRVDPSAMTVEVLVDPARRVWVPFLGGSWGF